MRLDYYKLSPESSQAMQALEDSLKIDTTLKDLVKTRISQINGCVFCTDMHVKEAKLNGERELRLYHLPVWRESSLFTDKERAALDWAEKLTNINHIHISAADFAAVREHFSEQEVSDLTFAITAINAWNRLGTAFAPVPGSIDKLMGLDKAGLK